MPRFYFISFFPIQHQMFHTIVLALCILVLLYIGYLLLKGYNPSLLRTTRKTPEIESFAQKPMGPPSASQLNMPSQPTPSPAPAVRQPPLETERTSAPGGPAAPNARAELPPTMSPEVMPIDPFQDSNMEAPIKDSMRHPELSFGPGMDNSGIKKAVASGVMNKATLSSESPFSPEFAQNGGQFMGEVTANDLSHDDTYAFA